MSDHLWSRAPFLQKGPKPPCINGIEKTRVGGSGLFAVLPMAIVRLFWLSVYYISFEILPSPVTEKCLEMSKISCYNEPAVVPPAERRWSFCLLHYLPFLFLSQQVWSATIFANGWTGMNDSTAWKGPKPPWINGIEKTRAITSGLFALEFLFIICFLAVYILHSFHDKVNTLARFIFRY